MTKKKMTKKNRRRKGKDKKQATIVMIGDRAFHLPCREKANYVFSAITADNPLSRAFYIKKARKLGPLGKQLSIALGV